MGNPFKGATTAQEIGRIAEKRSCNRLQATLMPGSGAMDGAKSDYKAGEFRVECKVTTKKSLSIKHDWLQKITNEANATGMIPALAVQFVDSQGNPKKGGSFVAIPEWLFKDLVTEAEQDVD